MRTKKTPPSRTSDGTDLPTARKRVRLRMREIVRDRRQQHPTLLAKCAEQSTFLDDFSLRRLENGCIKLDSPYGYPLMPRKADIGIETFLDWLLPAAIMKIRMLALAELNRLTGRESDNPLHLGVLLQDCGMLVNTLISNPGQPVDVRPQGQELRAFLDPEVLNIVRRARDTFSPLAICNTVAANRETWLSLEAQSPILRECQRLQKEQGLPASTFANDEYRLPSIG